MTEEREERKDASMVIEGCLASFLATIWAGGAGLWVGVALTPPAFLQRLMPSGFMALAVAQLFWLVPIALAFAYFRRRKAVIGVAIGAVMAASVVFLLSAICGGGVVRR